MPPQTLQVETHGLDKLLLKLGHVTDPVKKTVEEAGKYAQKELRVFAKPHPGDKGTIGTSSRLVFSGIGADIQVLLTPAAQMKGIARVIEEGRKPGKGASAKSLKVFAARHGIVGDKGLVWRMRNAIKAHGTKGVHMFAKTSEATEKEMGALLKKCASSIEKDWRK